MGSSPIGSITTKDSVMNFNHIACEDSNTVPLSEVTDVELLRAIAQDLYTKLDDIDTASDIFLPSKEKYADNILNRISYGSRIVEISSGYYKVYSDGYKVLVSRLSYDTAYDLDGTLCVNPFTEVPFDSVSPSESTRMRLAAEKTPLGDCLSDYFNHRVLVVTGRPHCDYVVTKKWLDTNNIRCDLLCVGSFVSDEDGEYRIVNKQETASLKLAALKKLGCSSYVDDEPFIVDYLNANGIEATLYEGN